jgi:hypothetical protein
MFAGPARAQNVLWVANNGSDANICTQTAPCATFQGAIDKGSVAQINCLTSGSYGTAHITASITIDCGTGNVGNIVGVTAITINATSAVKVVLRHLSLNGLDNVFNGILTEGDIVGSLTIEDCTLQRYTGAAIVFQPSSGRGLLQVTNSQVINSSFGITIGPAGGQIASVILNRVEISGNTNNGLTFIDTGIVAGTIRDSVVASNGGDGVHSSSGQVFFTVESSSIIANLTNGINAPTAGSNINVTGSTISGNLRGINAAAGSVVSFGNNTLNGNATDGAFTSTTTLK